VNKVIVILFLRFYIPADYISNACNAVMFIVLQIEPGNQLIIEYQKTLRKYIRQGNQANFYVCKRQLMLFYAVYREGKGGREERGRNRE
jgi:hypothetical protein